MIDIINDLLDCHELTFCKDGTYWMNLWSSKHKAYQVDINIFQALKIVGIIQLDSGNFETGEQHYIINVPNRTHNKLKNINNLIDKYTIQNSNNTLGDILYQIKKIELRKYKIIKLKEKIKHEY